MEIWDAYDRDFNIIKGKSLVRGEGVPEGCFHLVCEIIVRHSDGSYLLMQRDKNKNEGGKWEATAGGAAWQGESPAECAARELYEETGIHSDMLIELGRMYHYNYQSIFAEYLCNTNCNKDSIRLQAGETIDYKWVSAEELKSMTREELATGRILNFIEELVR